jgi:chromosomal replication initiation ATPase DnaA
MALALELTKASFPTIAREFAGRHSSTVISAVQRSYDLYAIHPEYLEKRNEVVRMLGLGDG